MDNAGGADNSPRPRSRTGFRLAVVAGAALLAAAIGVAGYISAEIDAPQRLTAKVSSLLGAALPDDVDDAQTIRWTEIPTNLHFLQSASIKLVPPGKHRVWAMESVGPHILFATRFGHLGYLDGGLNIHTLDNKVPMGLTLLRASDTMKNPIFDIGELRTLDLLAVPASGEEFDLYASHHAYEGDCFSLEVSRARIRVTDAEISFLQPWEDMFAVAPCLPIKDAAAAFAGHEGGGRLVLLDPDTILLSVGDFQFNGMLGPPIETISPTHQLSKIIAIDRKSGEGRIFARGFRNPQGLVIDRNGAIWETEHGPQGGDEINLIVENGDYGWPRVSYGMGYDAKPEKLPGVTKAGAHDGFIYPRFAFTPSVGISQIAEPDPREFPDWDTHLIVGSLRAGSLFLIKREGDDLTYAEPISMDGARVRDIEVLPDGQLAILEEEGFLRLIRNGERHEDSTPLVVRGLLNVDPALVNEHSTDVPVEIEAERAFYHACAWCHTHGDAGTGAVGPDLAGIVGRDIASVDGYPYSRALRDKKGKWTRSKLQRYIMSTDVFAPGTTMPQPHVQEWERDLLLDYLSQH